MTKELDEYLFKSTSALKCDLKCFVFFKSIVFGRHGQRGHLVAQYVVKEQEREFVEYCLMKKMAGLVKVIALKLHMLIVENVLQVL